MRIWEEYLDNQEVADTPYLDQPRKKVLDLFTSPRRRILEVGSSTGATGLEAKKRFSNCEYWGIEPRQKAAEKSRPRLDRVLIGMCEDFHLQNEGLALGSVDGLIFADVLEHMYNPWKALTDLRPYLHPDAEIITSMPNLSNLININQLVEGRFTYEGTGVLDITHIRFFTLYEQQMMLEQTGYKPQTVVYDFYPALESTYQQYEKLEKQNPGQKYDVNLGRMTLNQLSFAEIVHMCSFAFIIRSKVSSTVQNSIVSA